MKKSLLILGILLVPLAVKAPTLNCLYIPAAYKIEAYSRLIHAVNMVEAYRSPNVFDTLAYNPIEQATGAFQIRPIRLAAYNKATGKNYKLRDMFNYGISKEIFIYYAVQNGLNYEKIAKSWNGSGPKTEVYWRNVQKYLHNNEL